jgi:acylphosphatase
MAEAGMSEAGMKAVDVLVSGQVQGVSFRAYARDQARSLGVHGWIRNEADGSVAGHFEGDADAVDALVEWCRSGPSYALVESVSTAPSIPSGTDHFTIRI